ncbi:MAG TPA: BTAD domain-containing putative transcriptional regulator [Solirubrobacteraceae bacterium]|nr:BTAD domain-containing putative transcriptional regulator [Solirubrobacteraceae bacterium]
MRVGILGTLAIERDGDAVEVAGGRLRALLARLALDAGRPVTSGALAEAVWEEVPPGDEQHALQSLVSRLRRSLGDGGAIAPAPAGYRLAVAPDAVDAHRFEALSAAGASALRAGDPMRAAAILREALELWRGPALADLADRRFAVAAAAGLESLRAGALADLAEAELALGRGAGLVSELEAAVAAHPLHERLAARLIAARYAAGRQADALAAYESIRARLADELGAVPSPELQAAHVAVLQGEPSGPPAPAASRRSNLRAPVTSFVGRESELEHISALLEHSRLVTLVGPGGAGKTRLAGEAVAERQERVADGVWMVELAPVNAEVEVVAAVLGALGIRDPSLLERRASRPREGLERLLDVLAERDAILVLDNCEHLIGAAAQLAEDLLGHCPRLRIVATSREPLAIAGESLAPVPPLALPEPGAGVAEALAHPAVELFADRAAAARPGFAVDEETVALCVEVCRRLDGLPLAIELAAARLRTMPLETLAERLDDRFRLLTGGSRTALPRHRTLRAVVDWSWELLDERERRFARRLAVLRAGPTAESAIAVAAEPGAGEADALDALAALADRSLLQVVPGAVPPRYRMLETIREYGMEKLEAAGELAAVRDAHARWFAALAERADPELRGAGQVRWFRRLEAERDDVIAALRWLGDSGDASATHRLVVRLLWFWMLTGSPDEARAWTEFALGVPGDADPHDRLILEGVSALAAATAGGAEPDDVTGALAGFGERLEEIGDGGSPLLAMARPVLAFFAGDGDAATARLAETIEHEDPWLRATGLLMRAHQAENEGDQLHMRADLDRAADAFRAVGDSWGVAMTLASLAGTLLVAGELDEAETVLAEAIDMIEHISGNAGAGLLAIRRIDIRVHREDLAGAREEALAALDSAALGADGATIVLAILARIAHLDGDVEELRGYIAQADERLERIGPRRRDQVHSRAFVDATKAMLAGEEGDEEAAAAALDTAHEAAVATGDMPIVAAIGVTTATAAARVGRPRDAAEMLGAADRLRGGEDPAAPDVARLVVALREALGAEAFAAARAAGRALDRAAAIERLRPVGVAEGARTPQ